jgi:hypothetical protein
LSANTVAGFHQLAVAPCASKVMMWVFSVTQGA